MSLLPVSEALSRVLARVARSTEAERVPFRLLRRAHARRGPRGAARPAALRRPPPWTAMHFAAPTLSRRPRDLARHRHQRGRTRLRRPDRPAARPFASSPARPCPEGADAVVLQEDAERDGDQCHPQRRAPPRPPHPAGRARLPRRAIRCCSAGQRIDARMIALAAAMGHGSVLGAPQAPRRAFSPPATSWCAAGEPAGSGPDRRLEPAGGHRHGGASRRARPSISASPATLSSRCTTHSTGAERARADLLVTLGGASVGEHDLVQKALSATAAWISASGASPSVPASPSCTADSAPSRCSDCPATRSRPSSARCCFSCRPCAPCRRDPAAADDPSEAAILGIDLPGQRRPAGLHARAHALGAQDGARQPFGESMRSPPIRCRTVTPRCSGPEALLVRPPTRRRRELVSPAASSRCRALLKAGASYGRALIARARTAIAGPMLSCLTRQPFR